MLSIMLFKVGSSYNKFTSINSHNHVTFISRVCWSIKMLHALSSILSCELSIVHFKVVLIFLSVFNNSTMCENESTGSCILSSAFTLYYVLHCAWLSLLTLSESLWICCVAFNLWPLVLIIKPFWNFFFTVNCFW